MLASVLNENVLRKRNEIEKIISSDQKDYLLAINEEPMLIREMENLLS